MESHRVVQFQSSTKTKAYVDPSKVLQYDEAPPAEIILFLNGTPDQERGRVRVVREPKILDPGGGEKMEPAEGGSSRSSRGPAG